MAFFVNKDIDMTQIVDSMQLDSDQTIASLTIGDITASIEVRGAVKVWWNEKAGDPTEGDYYIYPSEFPDKLKQLIAGQETSDEGHWTLDPRVYISENNWFELFVGKTGDPVPTAECVDIEGYTPEELYDMLFDAINDYKKDLWLNDTGITPPQDVPAD